MSFGWPSVRKVSELFRKFQIGKIRQVVVPVA
jgi:hypothetical protein